MSLVCAEYGDGIEGGPGRCRVGANPQVIGGCAGLLLRAAVPASSAHVMMRFCVARCLFFDEDNG